MDFEVGMTYTDEQQAFRKEVRTFLDANVPADPKQREAMSIGGGRGGHEFARKLGEKGWFVPTVARELGGGGLTPNHAVVLNEELGRLNLGAVSPGILAPAIMIHGTEEQKKRFVVPWMRGEVNNWQVFTEPEAGSDLASLRTRGVRDGDEWVVNGSKQFISGGGKPDWLFTLVNTNPEAPRHENISLLMINARTPGVTIQQMDMIGMEPGGGGQHFVFFDNVRVPSENLIGDEGKGWSMANTTLELEHGGSGNVGGNDLRSEFLGKIIGYLKA